MELITSLKHVDSQHRDVYNIGVILVDLIIRLKPVDSHHHDLNFSNLVFLFIYYIMSVSRSHEQAWRIRYSILVLLLFNILTLLVHDVSGT